MGSLKNNKSLTDIVIISLSVFFLTFIIWLPHYLALPNFLGLNFSNGFSTIYRNFDGLEYITIAKTFYDPAKIAQLPQSLPANYYAAHFPGFPLFILLFAPFTGYLKSMLLVSLLFTVLSTLTFYRLVKDFNLTQSPLLLSIIFLLLPARWLIVHSIGSAEPVFIAFTLLSLYFFMKFEQTPQALFIHASAFFGLMAQVTRPPGILLFIALLLYILWKSFIKNQAAFSRHVKTLLAYHPLVLIPLALLAVFYLYYISYNDFFAYFHSGDNIHLAFPPFQVFNKHQFWVSEIWLEDIVYILIISFLGAIYLFKQKLIPLSFYAFTYILATTLVAHRDISRYALPIFPLLLIAFEKVLVSKPMQIVLLITALAIYLYTQNFLIENIAPIPNLQAFN